MKDLEEKVQENSCRDDINTATDQALNTSDVTSAMSSSDDAKQISDPLIEDDLARLTHECKSLQEMVQKLTEENAVLQVTHRSQLLPLKNFVSSRLIVLGKILFLSILLQITSRFEFLKHHQNINSKHCLDWC